MKRLVGISFLLYILALILNLLKDKSARIQSFNKFRTSAGECYHLGKLFLLAALCMVNVQLNASQAPYIPSYDEWYDEDLKQANADKDFFKEPEDALNYTQYHYVGAHAAEKYPRFFTEYMLQEQTILGMLATGVRGLMLSVYDWALNWSSIIMQDVSVVCSNPTKESTILGKNGKPLYQTLYYEMNRIFNFLKSHPKAVITIVFDDNVEIPKMMRDLKGIIDKNKYDPFLKPSNWAQAREKGEWPTLGWMRSHNKRLVLFTQNHDDHTEFTWPMGQYFWENNYGSIDPYVTCSEEKDSLLEPSKKNRSLVSFGCYGSIAGSPAARNSRRCFEYDFVKQLVLSCQRRRFARGKLFNAYWADHVIAAANDLVKNSKKTVFDYVNELNAVFIKDRHKPSQ